MDDFYMQRVQYLKFIIFQPRLIIPVYDLKKLYFTKFNLDGLLQGRYIQILKHEP